MKSVQPSAAGLIDLARFLCQSDLGRETLRETPARNATGDIAWMSPARDSSLAVFVVTGETCDYGLTGSAGVSAGFTAGFSAAWS